MEQNKITYKLISQFNDNDFIEFKVAENEDPETVALEQLGWTLVVARDEEED